MYNKNENLAKWSIFVRYLMSSFAYTTPFPPWTQDAIYKRVYICIATFNCPKGILGLGGGGEASKQTERRQFHLFNDKHHNFKYISYACTEGLPQSFGNEGHFYP